MSNNRDDAQPEGQVRTGLKDKDGREICLGDHIRYLRSGPHIKEEYWNPEFEVVWDVPSFRLKHIGGGKPGDDAQFAFKHWPDMLETIRISALTPAPDAATEPGIAEAARVLLESQTHPSDVDWQCVWDAMRPWADKKDLPMAFNKALRALEGRNDG